MKNGTGLTDHQVLVLYLMMHDVAISKELEELPSFLKHREYVQTLPRHQQMSMALWFNQAERDLLAGSNLGPAVEQREREWKAEHKALLESGLSVTEFTADEYSW